VQTPDIRPPGLTSGLAKPQSSQALIQHLGQLNATSPAQAVSAQVVGSREMTPGQFQITLRVQGTSFVLTAPAPPGISPISIYRHQGAIRVTAPGGVSQASSFANAGALLDALPTRPSVTALVIQSALRQPGFQDWAGVLAQLTQPDSVKRWIQAATHSELLKRMADTLDPALRERFQQQAEHRVLAQHEDYRQGLHSLRFDLPIPITERWINAEAWLTKVPNQRDCWSFRLLFELPTAGVLCVCAELQPSGVSLTLQAEQAKTHRALTALGPGLEQRLADAGIAVTSCRIEPLTPRPAPSEGHLDVHV